MRLGPADESVDVPDLRTSEPDKLGPVGACFLSTHEALVLARAKVKRDADLLARRAAERSESAADFARLFLGRKRHLEQSIRQEHSQPSEQEAEPQGEAEDKEGVQLSLVLLTRSCKVDCPESFASTQNG